MQEGSEVTDRDVEECLAAEFQLAMRAQPNPQAFEVGDLVEVISDRHGAELVGQTGKVTIANHVGCVVLVADQPRWFCTDELESAQNGLFPPKGWGVVKQLVAMVADDEIAF